MNGKSGILLKIALPVIIGLGVIIWLFYREYKPGTWSLIDFNALTITGIVFAWIFMAGRDFGLTWRFRSMTDKQLSWRQSLKVTMLCEFSSAITPSAVGGSAVGMLFLNKEGIEMGRATTLMMTTIFLDELFFVIIGPIVMTLFPLDTLFSNFEMWGLHLRWIFWLIYAGIALWTLLLYIGIFVKPHGVKRLLMSLFSFKILRRWLPAVTRLGDNMVTTSQDIRTRSARWWLRAFSATVTSWTSRFLIVNALMLAFTPMGNQLLILGRQFVLWVALMVCPTPGGSGMSEELFTNYYSDMFSTDIANPLSVAIIIALFWRIITYYVYLLIGIFLLPSFLSIAKNKTEKQL